MAKPSGWKRRRPAGAVATGAAAAAAPGVTRADPKLGAAGSTTTAYGQDPNDRYDFRYRVMEIDDLIASNTDTGAVNPDYSSELQPRDRTRQASQQQIDRAARNFVPDAALVDFHQLDKGTPIIGSDRMVESGNGRTLALRRMRQQYPEKWEEYQQALRDRAGAAGISEAELKQYKNPVLVRERVTEVNRVKFAQDANTSAVLRMSTQEQAAQDAAILSDSALMGFQMGEDESIDSALRRAGNRSFVQKFAGALPETERAAIMRSDGTLNRQGTWRIKGAMFNRVFPGAAGARMSETFLESLDTRTKNIESGIGGALPALMRASGQMSSGARSSSLDLTGDFAAAVDKLGRLRDQGMSVADYRAQAGLFGKDLTPRQERLLSHFDEIGRSSKKTREFFQDYAAAVDRSKNPNQIGLFGGGSSKTADDILDDLGVGK